MTRTSPSLALVLVLGACAAGPKEPTITREQQAQRCRTTTDQLVLLVAGGAHGGIPQAAELHAALLERCTTDRWSFDAQDCFGTLTSIDGADHCATLLTVPQRDGFEQAIETSLR